MRSFVIGNARRLVVLLLALGACVGAQAKVFTYHHENVLGTSMELRVETASAEEASRAEARVLGEIRRLDRVLSSYDSQSDFSRWQRGELTAPLPRDLVAVIEACEAWRARTGGAFDPRVAAVSEAWRAAAARNETPDTSRLEALRIQIASAGTLLDERGTPKAPGLPLSIDGLAKSYVIDRAIEAGMERTALVEGLLLDIGGDMRAAGSIGAAAAIADPFDASETGRTFGMAPLWNGALATSGNYARYFEAGGKRYSHIINPRTALPAGHIVSATVAAPTAVEADALATALSVLPLREGVALADALEGVSCLLVASNGAVLRSSGWQAPAPERMLAANTADSSTAQHWGESFELAVELELANPETEREYRRPYVAVWCCDEEGYPVRTVMLWYQRGGMKWLNSLKRWTRDDELRYLTEEQELAPVISRATRPPGSYKAVWDGKDDKGAWLPAGKYTLYIEASREHGTYQVITSEIEVGNGKTFERELEGNVEIGSAKIAYRPLGKR